MRMRACMWVGLLAQNTLIQEQVIDLLPCAYSALQQIVSPPAPAPAPPAVSAQHRTCTPNRSSHGCRLSSAHSEPWPCSRLVALAWWEGRGRQRWWVSGPGRAGRARGECGSKSGILCASTRCLAGRVDGRGSWAAIWLAAALVGSTDPIFCLPLMHTAHHAHLAIQYVHNKPMFHQSKAAGHSAAVAAAAAAAPVTPAAQNLSQNSQCHLAHCHIGAQLLAHTAVGQVANGREGRQHGLAPEINDL